MASKMYEGIKQALKLIEDGEYNVINGNLYRKGKRLGSLDKKSGNVFYVIKGVDIISQRLLYAYYHGIDSLKEGEGISHINGDRSDNRENNLVALPRKGGKQMLAEIRIGLCTDLYCKLPTAEEVNYTEKELQARAIVQELINGKTIKEVAEQFNVPNQRIYDIKKGKSSGKATADLREQL
ncbi:HNH endonuclease [Fictibacillus phosphorivorans]|uniref:HNH endonuclease n=1 Tax=Fictibacillus phosphorivorans TaxID=1221500 RepID=UPI003CF45B0B